MKNEFAIAQLKSNKEVFKSLLLNLSLEEYLWKPVPEQWSLLEIICHLYDEEREDFRARVKLVLETPEEPWPAIDPTAWVLERKYLSQNYEERLENFLLERKKSIEWLHSLKSPNWKNAYNHPKVGPVSAGFLLTNWLAHDYHHIRQINKVKYEYLRFASGCSLDYAGTW